MQVQKTNSELYVNIYCPVFCRVAACLPRHSGGPGYPWLAGLAGARLLTSLFMQPSCCHHPDTTPPPTSSSEVTNYPQYPPGIFVHFRCPLHVHAQLHTYCYALALDLWSVEWMLLVITKKEARPLTFLFLRPRFCGSFVVLFGLPLNFFYPLLFIYETLFLQILHLQLTTYQNI